MIRPIMRDRIFLAQKSEPATDQDLPTVQDLKDTLKANRNACVGMAANMIGVRKNIIIFSIGPVDMVMLNPEIVEKAGAFQTEEGCLSLDGVRPVTRYQEIEVEFLNEKFVRRRQKFRGWVAQIIQHECDHLEGILI